MRGTVRMSARGLFAKVVNVNGNCICDAWNDFSWNKFWLLLVSYVMF